MIAIASPIIEDEEIAAVNQVLHSGIIAQGPMVAQLETDFAHFCGTKYAVAVSSGTAALHCALQAAGVGPGDEVITTPFTFIATINAILMMGAVPRLVDIKATDFNIDPRLVEAAITPKTKAIIGVDLYGQPYDYAELIEIADRHQLALVEDACQSIGATYGHKPAGSLGQIGCFSLYATKNIVSGEGGMVTTDDPKIVEAVRRFRQHGMSSQYEYTGLGYNYRLTDIQAAIGVAQLKKAPAFTDVRQQNAAKLSQLLAGLPGIATPVVSANRTHVYHQYVLRVTSGSPLSRADLAAGLKDQGIGTGIYYPMSLHTVPHIARFGYEPHDFPVARQAAAEVLALPVHPRVSESDVHQIAKAIKELVNAAK